MFTNRLGALASTAIALLIIGLAVTGFWLMARPGNVPAPATNPDNEPNLEEEAAPPGYPPPQNDGETGLPGPTVTSTPIPIGEGYPAPGDGLPPGYPIPTNFPPTVPPLQTPVAGGAQMYDGLETGYAFSHPAGWTLETVQQNCCDRPDTFLRFSTGADIRPVVAPLQAGDIILDMTFVPFEGNAIPDPVAFVDVMQDPARQVEMIIHPFEMAINDWPVAASIFQPLDTAEVPFYQDESGEMVFPEEPEAHEMVLMAVLTPGAMIEMRGFAALGEGNSLYEKMVSLIRSLQVVPDDGGTAYAIAGEGLLVEIPIGWQVSEVENGIVIDENLNPQAEDIQVITLQYVFPEQNPQTISETLAQLPLSELREVEMPFALASRPDITWAMYQIFVNDEPYLVLAGVIPDPRTSVAGDYFLAHAVVPVEELDEFRPVMQQLIRSIRPAGE